MQAQNLRSSLQILIAAHRSSVKHQYDISKEQQPVVLSNDHSYKNIQCNNIGKNNELSFSFQERLLKLRICQTINHIFMEGFR